MLRLRASVLAAREQLAEGRRKLRAQHDAGSPGFQVCNHLTELCDAVLRNLFDAAVSEGLVGAADIALVAHGGYGRRDVAPYSDVDLMILYRAGQEAQLKPLVQRLHQDIVDAGLVLGSSFRTPEQACTEAYQDATVFTSLCESRFLGGANGLFERFLALFRAGARRRSSRLIQQVEVSRREERQQFGETTYLLQPNVKRSRGGLRDLQLLRWVGFARYGENEPESLVRAGLLTRDERLQLRDAHEFLLRLRNEMHFHAGKSQDLLDKSEQLRLAERYKYESDGTLIPVERFMRDYIEHTNNVRYITGHFVKTARQRWTVRKLLGPIFSHLVEGDFRATHSEIWATAQGLAKVRGDLAQVLRLMDLANRYDVRIAHPTWQAIRESMASPSDRPLTAEAASRFLSLLSQPARLGSLLRRLHELRVLEQIIPPMAHARGLMQFNEYHKFTVDEHSIRAVEAAADLIKSPDLPGEVYRGLKDKRLLHLALLLHDLGKGFDEEHCIVGKRLAADVARILRLSPRDTEKLQYLVEHHLLMSHLAQRRDIQDPEVILSFAVSVGSLELLQLLYLLTCSDLAAVGPGVLNSWKLDLLSELYRRTRDFLAGEGREAGLETQLLERRREVAWHLPPSPARDWCREQIATLPQGYLLDASPQQIAAELIRLRDLPPHRAEAWGQWLEHRQAMEYSVCAREEITPGIFHKLTGVLTSKRMQILSAAIHTLAGNLVLDRFYVSDLDFAGPPPSERVEEVTAALVAVLLDPSGKPPVFARVWRSGGSAEVAPRLPTQVRIDNSSSDRFTIIDVFAHDRLGLLYAITRAIFEQGLSVHVAKIGTHIDQVVDVFYVTTSDGQKVLDDTRLETIRQALIQAIDSP